MKKLLIILLCILLYHIASSQQDTISLERKKNRYAFGFIPSMAPNIYGLAIGPIGSETVCNRLYTQVSNGLNMQLFGQGFFLIFQIGRDNLIESNDSALMRVVHNGIILTPFGTFTDKINGVSVSSWMSCGLKINGLSINPLWNVYTNINGLTIGLVNSTFDQKGMQIGLSNNTVKLKGIQIGLWNKNEKRALPIINWKFKD